MTIEKSKKKYCQKCALEGIQSPLQLFQLNEEESLLMCKNVDCTFMPSSNWESLVVKRNIDSIPTASRSAGRSSTGGSSLSVHSAPAHLTSKISKGQNFSVRNGHLGLSSSLGSGLSSSLASRRLESPTPEVANQERKTLVPLDPFLCGHAQSFASFFETKKIEDQRLQHQNFVPSNYLSRKIQLGSKPRFPPHQVQRSASTSVIGLKRRGSSVDSDSISGSSDSLNSRPTSPDSGNPKESETTKKLRRIVISSDTLAQLASGSLELKIVKGSGSETNISIEQPVESNGKSQPTFLKELKRLNSGAESHLTVPTNTLDISGHSEESIQAHIVAINSHFEAINKALGYEACQPYIDHLTQLRPVEKSTSGSTSTVTEATDTFMPIIETSSEDTTRQNSPSEPVETTVPVFIDEIDLGLDVCDDMNDNSASVFTAEDLIDN